MHIVDGISYHTYGTNTNNHIASKWLCPIYPLEQNIYIYFFFECNRYDKPSGCSLSFFIFNSIIGFFRIAFSKNNKLLPEASLTAHSFSLSLFLMHTNNQFNGMNIPKIIFINLLFISE